jgi:hypothetical protein
MHHWLQLATVMPAAIALAASRNHCRGPAFSSGRQMAACGRDFCASPARTRHVKETLTALKKKKEMQDGGAAQPSSNSDLAARRTARDPAHL